MTDLSRVALLVIDVQNDFLPGGALAIPDADSILAPVNALMALPFAAIVASRDWHPPLHVSFQPEGGPWPVHCVAGTKGAAFPPALERSRLTHIVHKGLDPQCDSYSAFFDNARRHRTGLEGLLRDLDITRVVLCGLALDVCVAATAMDAVGCGFGASIVLPACRAVRPDTGACLSMLRKHGIGLGTTLAP
ncbi:nicotinamidase [Swaminathania salitolerans]|uniref:nicotinamidase n=1 Tax=Swaminathania salitolerans TaxID=182838 RepID=A0A511BRK1_9PROT|nr:nicotinamidase [Swaminathania salitolerans]GBQ11001.1 nicotinamidase [Swaminathania salitolerans LMG 21291]GEL02264.1 nicotinamidase [Swaminathania salitolerans]